MKQTKRRVGEEEVGLEAQEASRKKQKVLSTPSSTVPSIDLNQFIGLTELVIKAHDQNEEPLVIQTILAALQVLRDSPSKPNLFIYLSLALIAKKRPEIFQKDQIVESLSSLLQKDGSTSNTLSSLLPVLACNLLYCGFRDQSEWPEEFVDLYLQDAISERNWVDHKEAKVFVDNILTAFPEVDVIEKDKEEKDEEEEDEKEEEQEKFHVKDEKLKDRSPILTTPTLDVKEEDEDLQNGGKSIQSKKNETLERDIEQSLVQPRYGDPITQEKIHNSSISFFNSQFEKFSTESNQKNLIRVAIVLSQYREIANLCSLSLESWLNTPITTRYAKELLTRICSTMNSMDQEAQDFLQNFLKVKPKSSTENFYFDTFSNLLQNHSDYSLFSYHFLLTKELSGSRNPNFFKLMTIIMQLRPSESNRSLGSIFQEFLILKPDIFPLIISIFQRLSTLPCFDTLTFISGLFQSPHSSVEIQEPSTFFSQITELYQMCSIQLKGIDTIDLNSKYQISTLQCLGMKWFRSIVISISTINSETWQITKYGQIKQEHYLDYIKYHFFFFFVPFF